jgi:hypothetical protein
MSPILMSPILTSRSDEAAHAPAMQTRIAGRCGSGFAQHG